MNWNETIRPEIEQRIAALHAQALQAETDRDQELARDVRKSIRDFRPYSFVLARDLQDRLSSVTNILERAGFSRYVGDDKCHELTRSGFAGRRRLREE